MTFKLGLTGSIGMGKSTTAAMFAERGCAVWDADACVHRLYAPGGPAIQPIAALVPTALRGDVLDRDTLRTAVRGDDTLLTKIEAIVHPLVRADRATFMDRETADILVFDIPLLFETNSETEFDAIACVWVDQATQKSRVLARGTMTEVDFEMILARQMPIDDKKTRADYLIETDGLDHAASQIDAILSDIRDKQGN